MRISIARCGDSAEGRHGDVAQTESLAYIRLTRIGIARSRCRAARKRSAHAWISARDNTSNIALWRARRSSSGMASAWPIAAATASGS